MVKKTSSNGSNNREEIQAILQQRLYEMIDLSSHAKQAHWTVNGANFIALHELFDQIHSNLLGHGDDIAERIMALGGYARGTTRWASAGSKLPDYPAGTMDSQDHVKALSADIKFTAGLVRGNIDDASELNDQVTADLLTEVARSLDKMHWLVASNCTHVR